jgi:hypothetical protein
MKPRTRSKEAQRAGNVLTLTIILVALMGVALTSYLAWSGNQNQSVARSLAWNQALPVAEAGIEEAFTSEPGPNELVRQRMDI